MMYVIVDIRSRRPLKRGGVRRKHRKLGHQTPFFLFVFVVFLLLLFSTIITNDIQEWEKSRKGEKKNRFDKRERDKYNNIVEFSIVTKPLIPERLSENNNKKKEKKL